MALTERNSDVIGLAGELADLLLEFVRGDTIERETSVRFDNLANRVRQIIRNFNNEDSRVELLWFQAESAKRHADRYRSRPDRAAITFRRVYEERTASYLEAIAILRGGVFVHALADVRAEFDRRIQACEESGLAEGDEHRAADTQAASPDGIGLSPLRGA
jgi:hypothetical protein